MSSVHSFISGVKHTPESGWERATQTLHSAFPKSFRTEVIHRSVNAMPYSSFHIMARKDPKGSIASSGFAVIGRLLSAWMVCFSTGWVQTPEVAMRKGQKDSGLS